MSKLPQPGNVILHTREGDVEMPESEALRYKPKPIVEGDIRFLWTRTVLRSDQEIFQKRLGEAVRFGDAVSPVTGISVPGNVGVFVREDHDIHTLKAGDFIRKYDWL